MSLRDKITAEIAANGPMPIDRYLALCLSDPEFGYYQTRDPLGRDGDFTTAPEISQMFGEMLGVWLASVWMAQGAPSRFILAELGPGRGTLMKDVLRVLRGVKGALDAAEICLVETSPSLRAAQKATLDGETPLWVDTVDNLPDGPVFVLANEFFDALPAKQFQKVDTIWMERCVALGDDGFQVKLQPSSFNGPPALPDGVILEQSEAAKTIAATLTARIADQGGAAIFVDYGDRQGQGDTLQAVQDHKSVGIFDAPGDCDLTTHVRFGDLENAALQCHFSDQGHFLERLGITARANALLNSGMKDAVAAHRRLTHPDEMGQLFKVLAMLPKNAPQPPGFEP